MRSLCVRVRKGEGESVRKKLLEDGLLDQSLYVDKDQDFLYLPVQASPEDVPTEEREFKEREREERDLGDRGGERGEGEGGRVHESLDVATCLRSSWMVGFITSAKGFG